MQEEVLFYNYLDEFSKDLSNKAKGDYYALFEKINFYFENTKRRDVSDGFINNLDTFLEKIILHIEKNKILLNEFDGIFDELQSASNLGSSLSLMIDNQDLKVDPKYFARLTELRRSISNILDGLKVVITPTVISMNMLLSVNEWIVN